MTSSPLPLRDDRPRLDRHALRGVGDVSALDHHVGLRHRRVGVALRDRGYAIVLPSATMFSSLSYDARSGWISGAPGSIAATKSLTAGSGSYSTSISRDGLVRDPPR